MKSKISAVIDESTIVNFKFIFKLLKRYKLIAFLIPFLVVGLVSYLYKSQNIIYSSAISFTYSPDAGKSPVSAMSALVEENMMMPGQSEILGISKSTSFLHSLASDIASDPNIEVLNFNNVFSKEQKTFKELTQDCRSQSCKIDFIREKINLLFEILPDASVKNKFNVVVKTLSQFTTDKIIYYVVKNFKKYRLEQITQQLQNQIELTTGLLSKKQESPIVKKITKYLEDVKLLKANLLSIEKKSVFYESLLSKKRISLEQEEISLKYTKSTLKKKISRRDKTQWKKAKDLRLKKELLIADITALEHTVGSRSKQDNVVIDDLKSELKKINYELDKFSKSNTLLSLGQFQEKKLKSKELIEFNISVLKDQIMQIEKSSDELINKKNDLISLINSKEEYSEQNKSTIAYMKLLQDKLLQIKLIKETIVSDVVFDEFMFLTKRYKRYSLMSVIPFGIVLTTFLTIVFIIIRYYFDGRIFDKEEFEVLFDDVSYIGEVPKMD